MEDCNSPAILITAQPQIEILLHADVYARFCRSKCRRTLFICCDTKVSSNNCKDLCKCLNVRPDYFEQVPPAQHTFFTDKILSDLHNTNHVMTKNVKQFFCKCCKKFEHITGKCHSCNTVVPNNTYHCKTCLTILNFTDLIDPVCNDTICNGTTCINNHVSSKTPKKKLTSYNKPIKKNNKHVFLKLSMLKKRLTSYMKFLCKNSRTDNSNVRRLKKWLDMESICISKEAVTGGIDTPLIPGTTDKVLNDMCSETISYISATADYLQSFVDTYDSETSVDISDDTITWEDWWVPSPNKKFDTQFHQFIDKRNIFSHMVLFPALLYGATANLWVLPSFIYSSNPPCIHDYETFNNFVRSTNPDIIRYYMIKNEEFSFIRLKMESFELVHYLDGFVFQVLSFICKYYEAVVPAYYESDTSTCKYECINKAFIHSVMKEYKKYLYCLESKNFSDSICIILNISKLGDKYLKECQVWHCPYSDKANTAISICVNVCFMIAIMMEPFMPDTSLKLKQQLNIDKKFCLIDINDGNFTLTLNAGHVIMTPAKHLFNEVGIGFGTILPYLNSSGFCFSTGASGGSYNNNGASGGNVERASPIFGTPSSIVSNINSYYY